MPKLICLLFATALFTLARSQNLGGGAVYSFLKLPNVPQVSALGGINISNLSNDIGLAFNNPALLRPSMHAQVTAAFNALYAGIKNVHLMGGYYAAKLETSFAAGIQYMDYGTIRQTDAAGNIQGSLRPVDYVAQLSASRMYGERWHYGAGIKFIRSDYGLYRSSGLAMDVGVSYSDTAKLLQASLVIKNMGLQLTKYAGTTGDALPLDVQVGITKRLQKAPFQFSLTVHHLHQFNIRYNDTSFNNENGISQSNGNSRFTADKFFRHIVFATQLYAGDKIEITGAYNHLRRAELNISNTANGLNGFSLGVGVLFKSIQLRYARAYYQNNTAYNQFGLNLQPDKLF